MRKALILLLIVSSVIGMATPGMADPKGGSNDKTVDVDVDGSNVAANSIEQALDNDGDQTNIADVVTLVGDTTAVSAAEANADASGEADANADDDDNVADASDNEADADADSGDAAAIGGIANSDVDQENSISQEADAAIDNEQELIQVVAVLVEQDASAEIEDSPIVDDNEVEDDSELEVDV